MSKAPKRITAKYLENVAAHYLGRYAGSEESLRRILHRRVIRAARHHGDDPDPGLAQVEALIEKFRDLGYLDDRAYAETLVRGLFRRGASKRGIEAKLHEKGIDAGIRAAVLATRGADHAEPEMAAAVNLARRRRLGPFGNLATRADRRDKDLAVLARAGFGFDIACRIVTAPSVEDLEDQASAT